MSDAVDTVGDAVSDAVGAIADAAKSSFQAAYGWSADAFESAKSAAEGAFNAVVEGVVWVVNQITRLGFSLNFDMPGVYCEIPLELPKDCDVTATIGLAPQEGKGAWVAGKVIPPSIKASVSPQLALVLDGFCGESMQVEYSKDFMLFAPVFASTAEMSLAAKIGLKSGINGKVTLSLPIDFEVAVEVPLGPPDIPAKGSIGAPKIVTDLRPSTPSGLRSKLG